MMFVVQGEKGDRIPTPGIFHSSQGVGQEINAFPAKIFFKNLYKSVKRLSLVQNRKSTIYLGLERILRKSKILFLEAI
jgi:hypothetical protein